MNILQNAGNKKWKVLLRIEASVIVYQVELIIIPNATNGTVICEQINRHINSNL